MRSASRLVILALAVLFLALPTAVSTAATEAPAPDVAAGQTSTPAPPQDATAPPGPTLEPADTEAQRAESRRKLVMGIASVVLIGIVVWGRSIRKKKKAKAG